MRRSLVLFASLLVVACASHDPNARTNGAAPDPTAFKPVALVLVNRCGSLDCHGSKYRNFRLYGFGGERSDPTSRPNTPDTTPDEVSLDYQAVLGVEPEIIAAVVAEGGKDPERLTLVRKARDGEAHKGGQRIVPGSDADACLLSWLASAVDANACKSAGGR
jgi:hypothetical protein